MASPRGRGGPPRSGERFTARWWIVGLGIRCVWRDVSRTGRRTPTALPVGTPTSTRSGKGDREGANLGLASGRAAAASVGARSSELLIPVEDDNNHIHPSGLPENASAVWRKTRTVAHDASAPAGARDPVRRLPWSSRAGQWV